MERNPHEDEPMDSPDPRENFELLSNEYAQALQALKAIEDQASTLVLFGVSDDLVTFIDQFLEMANRAKRTAVEKGEPNFAEWFDELIDRAESLRHGVVRG